MDEDRCLSYRKWKQGIMQSVLFLFLNVYVLSNVIGLFFLGGGVFIFMKRKCVVFSPTVGHEINLLYLDCYLG